MVSLTVKFVVLEDVTLTFSPVALPLIDPAVEGIILHAYDIFATSELTGP